MRTATLPKEHKSGPKKKRHNILIKPAHTINNNAYLPMATKLIREASAGGTFIDSERLTQKPRPCHNLGGNGKLERNHERLY